MRNLSVFSLLLFVTVGVVAQGTGKLRQSPIGDAGVTENLFLNLELSQRTQMRANEMAAYRQWATFNVAATVGIDYDIKYYGLKIRLNPDTTKYIKGSVTTILKTLVNNFSVVNFDFATTLTCDSVYYLGAKLAAGKVTQTGNVLSITIPTVPAGTNITVTTYYRGVPPVTPGYGNGTGFVRSTHGSSPVKNYIYTLSEPYSSFSWWPCKSMVVNDKADSMDMSISCPTGFRAASNGARVSETTIGSSVITNWHESYPIAAYQICAAVANYDQYPVTPDKVDINGTMMDYYNLIFPETNTAVSHVQLDKTKIMLTTYTSKFGDYPFKNEKYGNYTFGFGGGMEHNTFSGMNANTYNNATAWDVNAHELGHQWFGAGVTCGSWRDIWVNESFATYTEIVCAEFAPSVCSGETGLSWRARIKNTAMNTSSQSQSIYVNDTSTIATIFSPAVYVYERGGMVISMLRTLLGDAKFFQAIKNYEADPLLKYGNAYTADVKRHMQAMTSLDLTTFFSQWIYNTGFAGYDSAKWNNTGNKIVLQLPQTVTSSALSHFDMPLSVHIKGAGAGQDTSVVIYDKNGIMNYVNNGVLISSGVDMVQYDLSFLPTTVLFDDSSKTMSNGAFKKSVGLALLATNFLSFTGQKNLAAVNLWWQLDNAIEYAFMDVQRSNDGIHFTTIGHLMAIDYPNLKDFNYQDRNPLSGISYYRIKSVGKDGFAIYTKTIAIAADKQEGNYSISPNPAKDFILLTSAHVAKPVSVKIISVEGRKVKSISRQNISAGGALKIELPGLAAGNYFVEIKSEQNPIETKKIVVTN